MAHTKAELLHDLDHELATILLLIAAVRLDLEGEPSLRHRLELAEQGVARLQELVAADPARASSAATGTAVREVVGEIVETRRATVSTTLVLHPGPPVCVPAGQSTIWRLLGNLVDNAARAAGANGRVEIELIEGPPAVVRVRDDGPGFGRSEPGRSGLGLGIVRSLAASVGAEVDVESQPGRGTRVDVVFWGEATEPALAVPAQRKPGT